jgi:hypothetical protein
VDGGVEAGGQVARDGDDDALAERDAVSGPGTLPSQANPSTVCPSAYSHVVGAAVRSASNRPSLASASVSSGGDGFRFGSSTTPAESAGSP